jgi:hypothetical protein
MSRDGRYGGSADVPDIREHSPHPCGSGRAHVPNANRHARRRDSPLRGSTTGGRARHRARQAMRRPACDGEDGASRSRLPRIAPCDRCVGHAWMRVRFDSRRDARVVFASVSKNARSTHGCRREDSVATVDDESLGPRRGCRWTPESDLDAPGRGETENFFFGHSPTIGVFGDDRARSDIHVAATSASRLPVSMTISSPAR